MIDMLDITRLVRIDKGAKEVVIGMLRLYKDLKGIKLISSNREREISKDKVLRDKEIDYYLKEFEKSWNLLPETIQTILQEFYMRDSLKSGAGIRLSLSLSYSERQIHRLKRDGIRRLYNLLILNADEEIFVIYKKIKDCFI